MRDEDALEAVWDAYQKNERPPAAIYKKLDGLPQAYRVQKGVLQRFQAKGETLAGWKIGGNSDTARGIFGPEAPFSGFLLESGHFRDGHTFRLDDLPGNAVVECELLITLGKRLTGPGVTRADVEAAVSGIAPALEVANKGRVPGLDLGQLVADNVSQWGYVVGETISPYPTGLDLGGVEIVARINGEIAQQGLAREVIDNQLDSLAWLANNLGEYGLALEAGHRVMTGSCLNPAVAEKGQDWDVTFTGVGSVRAAFR